MPAATTESVAALDLPNADDDFESFGAPVSGATVTLGSMSASGGATDGVNLEGEADPADIDFGALLGDVGADDNDPFAMNVSSQEEELFSDPFTSEDAPSTHAFEEADPDDLFVSSPNASGAAFDGDLEDEEQDDSGYGSAADEARAAMDSELRERRRQGNDSRPKTDKRGLANTLLGGLLVVLLGGIALEYSGYSVVDLLYSAVGMVPSSSSRGGKRQLRPIPQNLKDPTQILDTAKTYQLELERLKKVRNVRPEDKDTLHQVAGAYLDLLQRYPLVFLADHSYQRELKDLLAKAPQRRARLIQQVANQQLLDVAESIKALQGVQAPAPEDAAAIAWSLWRLHETKLRQHALDFPGRYSDPAIDPLKQVKADDEELQRGLAFVTRALKGAAQANNRIKFVLIQARLQDALGLHLKHQKALEEFVPSAVGSHEGHVLLIASHIRSNHLGRAEGEIKRLMTYAEDNEDAVAERMGHDLYGWLAQRRGQKDKQVEALQKMLELEPEDELTTVRLGRLLLRDKRAQECQKLLVDAKKRGMKSVAFAVALTEYWLWSNRVDDARAEIIVATKQHPKSVELLYLAGQVAEQKKQTTTAASFYKRVIEQQPDHLRAALRLASLRTNMGRHDVARQVLASARDRLGDVEALLEPLAHSLMALKETAEARKVYAVLLKMQPNHKGYLLNAARMDLKTGDVDRALGYLTKLRKSGSLDAEGAKQMAKALASKGKSKEAADTLVAFADRNPTDVRLNTLSGQYMLDSGQLERAETLLKRAFLVASRKGGDAEAQFQYGRLAFMQGDVSSGIMRMQQAIKAAPTNHRYRFALALSLLKPKVMRMKGNGKMAETALRFIIDRAPRWAQDNNEVTYLADVYRKLAKYYFDTQRYARAIPLLRKSLGIEPSHLQTNVLLGNALYQEKRPEAQKVLKQVLRRQPNNHEAALYLGLTLLNARQTSAALRWFQLASKSQDPKLAEAWYHKAMIHRDRNQRAAYRSALQGFLKRCPKSHHLREDAAAQLRGAR